jgi:hypothetical protein
MHANEKARISHIPRFARDGRWFSRRFRECRRPLCVPQLEYPQKVADFFDKNMR